MSQTPFLRNLVSLVHSPKAGSESPAYLRSFKNEGLCGPCFCSAVLVQSPRRVLQWEKADCLSFIHYIAQRIWSPPPRMRHLVHVEQRWSRGNFPLCDLFRNEKHLKMPSHSVASPSGTRGLFSLWSRLQRAPFRKTLFLSWASLGMAGKASLFS